jgi:hypothetical protein
MLRNKAGVWDMSKIDEMKRAKYLRAYGKPCRITLRGGQTVTVDRFEMMRTYIGLIEGIPGKQHIESHVRAAEAHIKEHWKRPRIVVIPPDVLDAESGKPVLPPLTMMAQLLCMEPRHTDEDGSWLNLVWFAEIDDQKSINDFVESTLKNVDWDNEAESFHI